jgi:hypothetical protein
MAAKDMHGNRTCAVEVSPDPVDAGADLTITVRVSCPDGCDLSGQSVSIRNQDDVELAHAQLSASEDGAYVMRAFALRAPLQAGAHIGRAVLAVHEKNGVVHQETSTKFSFTAMAHAASVNVWGLPSAIAAGGRFRFTVGIKCSAGCKLAGRPLSLFDHLGAQVGAARLGEDIWPGTGALYWAEIDAQAPLTTGDYEWQVETPGSDLGVPHAAGSRTFTVKIVSSPDYEVTVEAIDSEKRMPITGAHVLLHPYRAATDEKGIAKVKVAKGRYKLVVSGFRYIAYHDVIDVMDNVTMRAQLTKEPEEQDDYR